MFPVVQSQQITDKFNESMKFFNFLPNERILKFYKTSSFTKKFKDKTATTTNTTSPNDETRSAMLKNAANDSVTADDNDNNDSNDSKENKISKLIDGLFKSLKYLQVVISKSKYEIIPWSCSAVLDSLVDVYNQLKVKSDSSMLNFIKTNINLCVARLIEWSDEVLIFNQTSKWDDLKSFLNKSKLIIANLERSIGHLRDFLAKKIHSVELTDEKKNPADELKSPKKLVKSYSFSSSLGKTGQTATRQSSLVSLSNVNRQRDSLTGGEDVSVNVEVRCEEKSGLCTWESVKTSKYKSKDATCVYQITKLTKSSNFCRDVNALKVSNELTDKCYHELEKIAFELSKVTSNTGDYDYSNTSHLEKPSVFTDEKCQYLVNQFETFAKNLKENEKSASKSEHIGDEKSPILYTNSSFVHDLSLDSTVRCELAKNVNANGDNNTLIQRTTDSKARRNVSFVRTNLVEDENLSKLLLDLNHSDPELNRFNDNDTMATTTTNLNDSRFESKCSSPTTTTDLSVDLNQKAHVDTEDDLRVRDLSPTFLLIDDDDDDDVDDCERSPGRDLTSNIIKNIIIHPNANSEFIVGPKCSAQRRPFKSPTSISLNSLGRFRQSRMGKVYSMTNLNLDTQSIQFRFKFLRNRLAAGNNHHEHTYSNILKLLNVSHVLEYQNTSNLCGSATTAPYVNTSLDLNSNNLILRSGPVDALIVLAASSKTYSTNANSTLRNRKNADDNNNNNNSINGDNCTSNGKKRCINDFLFQEAFLMTYRSFIKPIDLVNKLIFRYRYFRNVLNKKIESLSKVRSTGGELSAEKSSLTLLVRVLDGIE